MKRRRAWWAGALAVAWLATIAGLWLVTSSLRALEVSQAQSQGEFARVQAIRLALWRMDGWMTPRIARESARSVSEYSSFFAPRDTVNRLLQSVPQGEVLQPSPLLFGSPDWIPMHFEWRADGTLTSPQVPQGNQLDLAEGQYFTQGVPAERAERLRQLKALLEASKQPLDLCVAQAEASNESVANAWSTPRELMSPPSLPDAKSSSSEQSNRPTKVPTKGQIKGIVEDQTAGDASAANSTSLGVDDYATRARTSNEAQQPSQKQPPSARGAQQQSAAAKASQGKRESFAGGLNSKDTEVIKETVPTPQSAQMQENKGFLEDAVGPLVPAWLSTDPPQLAFLRSVSENGERRVQGFLVDWPLLCASLLAQVSDLTMDARLVPVLVGSEHFAPSRLASIPAELQGEFAVILPADSGASNTPALIFAWAAALMALAAAVLAAWMGISFGERQARFASSVTHELRTPLTTFQLYTQMLRDGMVTDEVRRQECLDTLCRESVRLSHLVENVLSLSRLERDPNARTRSSTISGDELEALIEAIARERAVEAVHSVHNQLNGARAHIDTEALSQIVANLIENAAKYGRNLQEQARIEITLRADGDCLIVRVRDHGCGIAARDTAAIWRPYGRVQREGNGQSGLGLGLAVSRALATRMGGTLSLLESRIGERGAIFELRVPHAIFRAPE